MITQDFFPQIFKKYFKNPFMLITSYKQDQTFT